MAARLRKIAGWSRVFASERPGEWRGGLMCSYHISRNLARPPISSGCGRSAQRLHRWHLPPSSASQLAATTQS